MANEDSALIREVDQELAEERQWRMFQKHGPTLIAGAVAVVAAVAGWQTWGHLKQRQSEEQSIAYAAALKTLETDATAGRAALTAVTAEKTGYATLANLQLAASYSKGGERLKALEIYRGLAKSDAPKRLRELAQLRAAHLALPDGRDAVLSDLGDLATDKGRNGYYAREIEALASLYAKDYEASLSTFRELSTAIDAPGGVRQRAEEFAALAAAAKDGVNFTGEARVEDLLKAVGDATVADDGAATDAVAGEATGEATDAGMEAPAGEDDHSEHEHAE